MNSLYLRVSDKLYRGPQPVTTDMQALKDLGVTTIVNLRSECDLSKSLCSLHGLEYVCIPVPDGDPPRLAQVQTFLDLFKDPKRVIVIHCLAGMGRTGTFASLYRIWMEKLSSKDALAVHDIETSYASKTITMTDAQRYWVHCFDREYKKKLS